MKFWQMTLILLVAIVLLIMGKVDAMMQYVYYWVGSSNSTITDTQPANNSIDNFIEPHVCYNKYGGESYDSYDCNHLTAIGLVDIPKQILWTYDENGDPQQKRFELGANGRLLPHRNDAGVLLRQVDHEDESVPYTTLHSCTLGATCEFDTSDQNSLTYSLEWKEDGVITYAGTTEPVHILPNAIFYSYDYTHTAAFDTRGNLVLINPYESSVQIIGYERSAIEHMQPDRPAVSVSGGTVMVLGTEGAGTFLRIYSYEVCNYNDRTPETKKYPCVVKDIWNGTILNRQTGDALNERVADDSLEVAYFLADDTIKIASTNSQGEANWYTIKNYGTGNVSGWGELTTLPDSDNPPDPGSGQNADTSDSIRLLAMGDSYISGEGAYSYRDGTDTSNNKCHLSTVSYPYLLGAKYAAEYYSVACSGAVINNIYSGDSDYLNQLTNQKLQRSYGGNSKQDIISNIQPGYIEQYSFVKQNKPNTILLSIGGNDIKFANIVKRCVLSFAGNPCYLRESERKGLLETIYGKHEELVSTYKKILNESPADTKLYVIGYPQVISPIGSCGMNVHFDDQERQFAVLLVDRLNATLKNAASSAGAIYVDTSKALVGHRLCDAADDGVNGLTSGDDSFAIGITLGDSKYTLGLANESYHPTALGHQLIAKTISDATDHLTKEPLIATGKTQLTVSNTDPFITSASIHDRTDVGKSVFEKIVDAFMVSSRQTLTISTKARSGASFRIVMFSDEVKLAEGNVPIDGVITTSIQIPNIEPGIHTIHIYTEDLNGDPIDINQDIYIMASPEDYDGDGLPNNTDTSPLINETGRIIASGLGVSSESVQAASIFSSLGKTTDDMQFMTSEKQINSSEGQSKLLSKTIPKDGDKQGHRKTNWNQWLIPIGVLVVSVPAVLFKRSKNKLLQ